MGSKNDFYQEVETSYGGKEKNKEYAGKKGDVMRAN